MKKIFIIIGIHLLLAKYFLRLGNVRFLKDFLLNRSDRMVHEIKKMRRGFFKEGRFYWNLYLPGYPSVAFSRVARQEALRLIHGKGQPDQYDLLFLAITNKCGLNCAHCFEWDALNKKEQLSPSQIEQLLDEKQSKHLAQIFFTGGEPLNRFDVLLKVLPLVKLAETWIVSSGWNLNQAKAKALRNHGLTGVVISLDHHLEGKHDQFRGTDESYERALEAIKNAQKVGLMTALSLCPTNEFIVSGGFKPYMTLAKALNVNFVQIIEPKPEGRNASGGLLLTKTNRSALEEAYNDFMKSKIYSTYPMISYPDYLKRLYGCEGVTERHRYIDTEGIEHPCPFCKIKGNGGQGIDCQSNRNNGCYCSYELTMENMS